MQHEENQLSIPILLRRQINQNEYKPEEFQFQVNLDRLVWKAQNNKDPGMVVIKTLLIKRKEIIVSYEKKPRNRLMTILGHRSEDKFLFLNFDIYKTERKYAKSILKAPIVINKEVYHFFGYSKSNLKSFSCYFYQDSPQQIVGLFNSLGNFNQIYSISKKAARLSMLYSQGSLICSLENNQVSIIKDVIRNETCFSDGCGYISLPLARKIKRFIKEVEGRQLQYLPSVYQIRIKGIKGIVVLNPSYDDEQIIARESMLKFNAREDKLKQLLLVNYSKPAHYAAINQQIIMLLNGLGIASRYFLELQNKYLDLLRNAIAHPALHIELLTFLGKQEVIQDILANEGNRQFRIKSMISEQIYRNIKNKQLKSRLRIPLDNARFLYGAVYPEIPKSEKALSLKANQVFVRVTTGKGIVQTIIGTVIVTKNPCYYCGDIRILEAVDISHEFPFSDKLADVILFSTKGDLPLGTTIAGSDYDGDQYFVCWDQNLIPKRQIRPYTYPASPPKQKNTQVTQSDLVNHLVHFDRSIVARINSRFLSYASISRKGVRCKECVELGTELFSRAIDSVSTGEWVSLPDHLNHPNQQQIRESHIWIQMTERYEKFFESEFKFDDALIASWGCDITYEMMLGIIQTYVAQESYNDYQLFKILKTWYLKSKSSNYALFKYINFSELNIKQKKQIHDLPNFPKQYLGDPFEYSPIFSCPQLKKTGLSFHTYEEAPKKWRAYYKSQGDDIDFENVQEALTKFNNVLIGIQVNEEVRLIFWISRMPTVPYIENNFRDQNLRAFYIGYNEFKEFKNIDLQQKQYKMFYSEELLQIYQTKRQNSFFWFRNGQVSIDLTRFDRNMLRKHPRINKEKIRYLQVFVGRSENDRQIQIKKMYIAPKKHVQESWEKMKQQQMKLAQQGPYNRYAEEISQVREKHVSGPLEKVKQQQMKLAQQGPYNRYAEEISDSQIQQVRKQPSKKPKKYIEKPKPKKKYIEKPV